METYKKVQGKYIIMFYSINHHICYIDKHLVGLLNFLTTWGALSSKKPFYMILQQLPLSLKKLEHCHSQSAPGPPIHSSTCTKHRHIDDDDDREPQQDQPAQGTPQYTQSHHCCLAEFNVIQQSSRSFRITSWLNLRSYLR